MIRQIYIDICWLFFVSGHYALVRLLLDPIRSASDRVWRVLDFVLANDGFHYVAYTAQDVQVVGVPDDKYGEQVGVFLIPAGMDMVCRIYVCILVCILICMYIFMYIYIHI